MNTESPVAAVLLEDETLRDGLQIETRVLSSQEKINLFNYLKASGIKRIQVGSFVNPKVVPQMADTDELIRSLGRQDSVVISGLILNGRGLDRALACGVGHLSMSVSISDSHSRRNARKPAAEALLEMTELIGEARAQGVDVRAGLQSAFGCVYEGSIREDDVVAAAHRMAESGANEINLADTSGMATPMSVSSLVHRVGKELPQVPISLHLHDTRGLGLANMFAGYQAGVRTFDVCTGGLGGCPFVKGAAGNVPTEDAVNLFESMGIATGIRLSSLIEAVTFLEETLGRSLPGRMKRVYAFQESCDAPDR